MARWIQKRWKKSGYRTCPSCGFDQIRKEDNFCMMCGVDVRGDDNNARRQAGIRKENKTRTYS